MVPYRSGDLNRQVAIKRRAVAKDPATGREVVTWPDRAASVWAARRDVSGREQMAAGQIAAQPLVRWVINYRTDVVETDRVYDGSTGYDVQHIAEIGTREFLVLTCKRVIQP